MGPLHWGACIRMRDRPLHRGHSLYRGTPTYRDPLCEWFLPHVGLRLDLYRVLCIRRIGIVVLLYMGAPRKGYSHMGGFRIHEQPFIGVSLQRRILI